MKVTKLKTKDNFHPVDVVVTIETLEELNLLRTVYLVKAETSMESSAWADTNMLITKLIDAIVYEVI
jgi:hypothetical protein